MGSSLSVFCDFSYRHYISILTHAKEEYAIGSFREYSRLKKFDKFIIMRHDVDYSLKAAVAIAKIESRLGIRTTYFLLLHSPYYNILEETEARRVREILDMGHQLGLHFDNGFYSQNDQEISRHIAFEARLLSDYFGTQVSVFSQHDAYRQTLPTFKATGLPRYVFAPEFRNGMKYISDSVQNWREGCLCRHLGRNSRLHVLLHPIWWSYRTISRQEILVRLKAQLQRDIRERMTRSTRTLNRYLKQVKGVKR